MHYTDPGTVTTQQHRHWKMIKDFPAMATRLAMRWQYAETTHERVAVRQAVNEMRPTRNATYLAALVMKVLMRNDTAQAEWFADFMKPMKLAKEKRPRMPFESVRRKSPGRPKKQRVIHPRHDDAQV